MTSIWWLARDFRFHDNEALALAAAQGPVLPVFLIDASVAALGAAARWRLEQALTAFDAAWQQRTGQRITLLTGEAEAVLPDLAAQIGADLIVQNDWPWAPMQKAQARLRQSLAGSGVRLQLCHGHLLISPQRVHAEKGKVYRVYTPFARAVRMLGPDRPVAEAGAIEASPSRAALDALLPLAPDMRSGAPVLAAYALPAGEAAALARLEDFLPHASAYPEGRDYPNKDVCSGLSEALALGEISPRLIWERACFARELYPAAAQGIDKFLNEILWREFAWHLLLDFPQMARESWRADWRDFPWQGESAELELWRRAQTGVPLVDAGLREMRVTGRMHNRVRMVVASWLTKHLLTDWRLGEAFFADSLTDWDPAANAMNWQWVAGCGPDASPFFRIFNPLKQAEQYDPKGGYRARWLQSGPEYDAYRAAIPPEWRAGLTKIAPVDEADLKPRREAALAALAFMKERRDFE